MRPSWSPPAPKRSRSASSEVEQRTQHHLTRARRNRDVADALIGPNAPLVIDPPPHEWAVVAAFYAAVHYVNGYLWEKLRHDPANHENRRRMVSQVRDLRPASDAYGRLQDRAFLARYADRFNPPRAYVDNAVQIDLRTVERRVLSALAPPKT